MRERCAKALLWSAALLTPLFVVAVLSAATVRWEEFARNATATP
jgi:hypothetical protein